MIREKYFPSGVMGQLEATLSTLDYSEVSLCRRFNRYLNWHALEKLFAAVSRVGDGVVWYATMLLLPVVWGKQAFPVVVEMLVVGLVGLIVYKKLKQRTKRQRPCQRHFGLKYPVAPLDEYSFPSGHTLHAVGFTVVVGVHFPVLLWVFAPLTVLIAMSRVVLGLHYPSDVVVGALIGSAASSLVVMML